MKVAKFEFSLFGINTYVVYDPATKKCAVIDPGMSDQEEEEALTGFITRNGLTVTHIINTHLHIDHAIGDRFASETFGFNYSVLRFSPTPTTAFWESGFRNRRASSALRGASTTCRKSVPSGMGKRSRSETEN